MDDITYVLLDVTCCRCLVVSLSNKKHFRFNIILGRKTALGASVTFSLHNRSHKTITKAGYFSRQNILLKQIRGKTTAAFLTTSMKTTSNAGEATAQLFPKCGPWTPGGRRRSLKPDFLHIKRYVSRIYYYMSYCYEMFVCFYDDKT
jgi:hypothetical protein